MIWQHMIDNTTLPHSAATPTTSLPLTLPLFNLSNACPASSSLYSRSITAFNFPSFIHPAIFAYSSAFPLHVTNLNVLCPPPKHTGPKEYFGHGYDRVYAGATGDGYKVA